MKKARQYILIAAFSLCSITNINATHSSSYPFISGNTFRSICNHIVDETGIPFDPQTVKNGDIIFLKTDMAKTFFSSLHPQISARYILITHNSDLSPISLSAADHPPIPTPLDTYLDDPKIIVWFAQNIDHQHPKLKPIPIGVANSHWRHGNVSILQQRVREIPSFESRKDTVYINCPSNSHPDRIEAVKIFSNKSFCYHVSPKPFSSYLAEMSQFKFVLSPPGNGFDCHRTWEALLMGCIPIIKHSPLDSLYEELPVIFVHDWHEINPEFLQQQLVDIQNKKIKLEKLYADYWISYINSYQKIYQNT